MPFNGAIISIMLRGMRDMAEFTLSTYIIFTMLVVYLPIFLIFETTDVYYKFTLNDWFVSVLLGFTSSSMQLVRTKALKFEEPARLSILNYFQPIIQLLLDFLFFQSLFTNQQILGALIVFLANSISWIIKLRIAFFKGPKEEIEEAKKTEMKN